MSNATVTLIGNVTRDPELRYTPSGAASLTLGLAVNRRWQNRQTQEWEEAVSFFDVVCWRELAENTATTVAKGMRLIVTGRLEQRSWEDSEGERHYKVEVIADEVGPSLRWATADVARVERGEAGERAGNAKPAATRRSQRRSQPKAEQPEDAFGDDDVDAALSAFVSTTR